MTETVNYTTGEIATVNPSSEIAVTSYLQQARDWLATAVESTGPEQIARAKAEIATAAEATKQLGLSKEIREDATEMVRRAEWALRKATQRGQEDGSVAAHGSALIPGARTRGHADTSSSEHALPSPKSFFNTQAEYEDAVAMGKASPQEFEGALSAARADGDLSRANVVRKIRGEDPATERKHQEAELINAFRALLRNLTPKNISTLSPKARGHLVAILRDTITKLEG